MNNTILILFLITFFNSQNIQYYYQLPLLDIMIIITRNRRGWIFINVR